MKANELMCDDIVLHHGNAYKVFGIMGKANGIDLFPVQLRNAEGLILAPLTCFATEIAPIPLTAEILEKNGWDGINGYRKYGRASGVFNDNYQCEIGLCEDGRYFLVINDWEYSICEINGVHELQHALRLCGLNDLADNFKV